VAFDRSALTFSAEIRLSCSALIRQGCGMGRMSAIKLSLPILLSLAGIDEPIALK
jgi:hypothetical protein